MQLITNNTEKAKHVDKICALIETSKVIILCTGWMNAGGIKKIIPSLKIALNNHAKITIYSNKKHTTACSIKKISEFPDIRHCLISEKYVH